MRAKVRRWLSWPGGGNLILPDDPEVEYRDVILVGAADWSSLFEDGECQLTFTLFDPIGWGAERVERKAQHPRLQDRGYLRDRRAGQRHRAGWRDGGRLCRRQQRQHL